MDETQKFIRSAEFEADTYNELDNTIEISFSSEAPYLRSHGWEILSHESADADFSRIEAGTVPFVLEHKYDDPEAHIGAVVKGWISGSKGRALIKFSSDESKQGIINDIKNGVRPNVSVGYFRGGETLVGQIEGIKAFKYKFQPYEISSVGVPVDITVGINRSIEPITPIKEPIKMEDIKETKTQFNEAEVRSLAIKEATQRAVSINDLCSKWNMATRAAEFINSEKTFDEIRSEVLNEVEKRSAEINIVKAPQDAIQNSAPAVHIKQERSFDTDKAFRAALNKDWSNAGYEREVCQERSIQSGGLLRYDQNIVLLDPNAQVTRAGVTATTAGSGAELVGTQYRPDKLIDALWNKTWLDKVGTDTMLGLQQNASIPVISSNATTSWVTESGNLPTAQGLTTSGKTIAPKEMVAKFEMTRQSLIQDIPNVQVKILDQLYKAIAQALDAAAWGGASVGLSTDGLINEITGSGIVAAGTNGGVASAALFSNMRKVLTNNKVDVDAAKFVLSSQLRETLSTTLKDSANTASGYILPYDQTTLAGLPYFASQNVPSNFAKGTHTATDLTAAVLGDWSEFLVAQWGSIAVEFDYVTGADNSKVFIRSFSFWDMLIKRLSAFAICKDIIG